MHTLKVIFAGLALLAAFVLLGRWLAHGASGASRAALYFVGVWLLLATANLMVGVLAAGYGMREELPIFVVVFAVPAVIALILPRADGRLTLFGGAGARCIA